MENVTSHTLYGDISRAEALERLPEISDIRDEELREQVLQTVRQFPDYFWTAPASSHHHPPEHQARHGLWLHTKRVCTAFERVAKSMVKQGHLDWSDIDKGRAACILHDMYKYGVPPTSVDSTSSSHDVTAANWLLENTQLPSEVIDAVEAHNGPWYAGNPPTSHLQQMVHIADLNASDENARYAVKDPHRILLEKFPRIEVRGDN
jgi:hypothetical protein